MSETVEEHGAKCTRMLGVQALAYVVFIVVALVFSAMRGPMDGVSSASVAVVAVVVLAVFHVCWPFRAGMADRIIGAVAGVLSLACVSTSFGSMVVPANDAIMSNELTRNTYPMLRWAAAVAGLLVLAYTKTIAKKGSLDKE